MTNLNRPHKINSFDAIKHHFTIDDGTVYKVRDHYRLEAKQWKVNDEIVISQFTTGYQSIKNITCGVSIEARKIATHSEESK